jgi:hypothetical protein
VWAFVAALGLLIESDEAVAKRRALSENNFLRMLSPVNSKGRLKREGELRRSTVTEIILGIRSLTFSRKTDFESLACTFSRSDRALEKC